MKIYIVQEIQEYKIYKVADNLIKDFEAEKKDAIVVQGNSIQEVLIGFDALAKVDGLRFNSELAKYKVQQNEEIETHKMKYKHRM